MPLIDTNHGRAALLVLLLGVALVIAAHALRHRAHRHPGPVRRLRPVHDWLSLRVRTKLAATLVVALALFLIVVPGVSVCRADREPGPGDRCWRHPEPAARSPEGAAARRQFDLGPRLADLGAQVVSWIGSSAFGLVGTATRLALNLTISLFGLF